MTEPASITPHEAWALWAEGRLDELHTLVTGAAPAVAAELPTWRREAVRLAGSAAADATGFLQEVLRALAAAGQAPVAEDDPFGVWQAAADRATEQGRAGRWRAALQSIEEMAVEVATWSGPGAIPYSAATLQMRAKARFHLGDREGAAADVRAAQRLWVEVGDETRARVCQSMLAELGVPRAE